MIKRILSRWRCRRAGVPREFWGTSNEGIPAEQWSGWNHTIERLP